MSVEVLVATTNQHDYSLIDNMNIQTDAIVGNQCDRNAVECFDYNGKTIKYLNFAEKGVGLNRNNCLMRASADYCLFADDDIVYVDGYEKIIEDAFSSIPQADVLIFNIIEDGSSNRFQINQIKRVRFYNYMRYGTVRIAVKHESIKRNGIFFNQCFGGGTEYSHGEDTLFLTSCLKNNLKIYTVPIVIASLKESRPSSWNHGYDEKYLNDQGILYHTISKRMWVLLCLQDAIRKHSLYGKSIISSFISMTRFSR